MKKLLLSIIISSFMFITGNAQNTGELQFGLGGGINFSSIDIDDDNIETGSLSSFNVAFSTEYYFDDRLGLKAKIIYDNKGWSGKTIDPDNILETIDTDFNLTYITVPIMANWHFGSLQSRAKSFVTRPWYVSLGPYVGFLTKAEDSELGVDLKESFKSIDFGAALNFGLRFEIADFTKLFVEYDGQYGFADISAGATTSSTADNIATKNGLRSSVNLGILFAFY